MSKEVEALRLLERMLDDQIRKMQSERAHIRRSIRKIQRDKEKGK